MRYIKISGRHEVLAVVPETPADRQLIREHYGAGSGFHKRERVEFTRAAVTRPGRELPAWLHVSNWERQADD